MRKSLIILLATLIFSNGTWAGEIKKSDILKGVKTYGSNMGTLEACMYSTVAGLGSKEAAKFLKMKLPDKIEAALFDKDFSPDSINYFQKQYFDAYKAKIDAGLAAIGLSGGQVCAQMLSEKGATLVEKATLNEEKILLELIEKYRK